MFKAIVAYSTCLRAIAEIICWYVLSTFVFSDRVANFSFMQAVMELLHVFVLFLLHCLFSTDAFSKQCVRGHVRQEQKIWCLMHVELCLDWIWFFMRVSLPLQKKEWVTIHCYDYIALLLYVDPFADIVFCH